MATTQHSIYFVVDLADPEAMTELFYILTRTAGNVPTFTPIVPLQDAGAVLPAAMASAMEAPQPA